MCSSSIGSATSLSIRENGTAVMLPFHTINATHKTFFINVDKHDNGRRFTCENLGFQSIEKVLTVYCKYREQCVAMHFEAYSS